MPPGRLIHILAQIIKYLTGRNESESGGEKKTKTLPPLHTEWLIYAIIGKAAQRGHLRSYNIFVILITLALWPSEYHKAQRNVFGSVAVKVTARESTVTG